MPLSKTSSYINQSLQSPNENLKENKKTLETQSFFVHCISSYSVLSSILVGSIACYLLLSELHSFNNYE